MQIARVIGTVVSTIKNESLDGRKILIVQTLDADLKEKGKPMVALDAVGAGVGELVFWCRGKEAAFPFKRDETPTDCTIVGIIDSDSHVWNVDKEIADVDRPRIRQRCRDAKEPALRRYACNALPPDHT